MIRGWRSDRRIGPPSLGERLRGKALWPIITTSGGAVIATISVLLKFDDLWVQLTYWPITFTLYSIGLAITSLIMSRWNLYETIITTAIIATVFLAASKLKLIIYSAVLGYEPAMIVPLTP